MVGQWESTKCTDTTAKLCVCSFVLLALTPPSDCQGQLAAGPLAFPTKSAKLNCGSELGKSQFPISFFLIFLVLVRCLFRDSARCLAPARKQLLELLTKSLPLPPPLLNLIIRLSSSGERNEVRNNAAFLLQSSRHLRILCCVQSIVFGASYRSLLFHSRSVMHFDSTFVIFSVFPSLFFPDRVVRVFRRAVPLDTEHHWSVEEPEKFSLAGIARA